MVHLNLLAAVTDGPSRTSSSSHPPDRRRDDAEECSTERRRQQGHPLILADAVHSSSYSQYAALTLKARR